MVVIKGLLIYIIIFFVLGLFKVYYLCLLVIFLYMWDKNGIICINYCLINIKY